MDEITEWTFQEFESNMISNRNPKSGKYEPVGFFLVSENDGVYSAIDNSTGCPYVESFKEKAHAIDWLKNRMG